MTVTRSVAQQSLDFNFPNQIGVASLLGVSENWDRQQTFFRNPDVDTGTTPENIWPLGGLITQPTSAGVTQLVSSSANDTAAGTGARQILVDGVGADYYQIKETVTLNGITPVNCTNNFLRINNLTCVGAGSGKGNAGNITVTINDGSPRTVSYIAAGVGISQVGHFTVPANYQVGLLQYIFINATRGGTGYCDFQLIVTGEDGLRYQATEYSLEFGGSSFIERDLIARPARIKSKMDVELVCSATSANNVVINALWTILMAKTQERIDIRRACGMRSCRNHQALTCLGLILLRNIAYWIFQEIALLLAQELRKK